MPSTIDRLRVFVSSTIKECAAERAAVREAIRSINHEPILFEDVGARPYPPREVYRSHLEISQIFVGIYRESYGWVAPDMDLSELEDEFRLAQAQGLDRLLYVYETPSARDPKLQALIEEAKSAGITLAGYIDPEQLKDRVPSEPGRGPGAALRLAAQRPREDAKDRRVARDGARETGSVNVRWRSEVG